MIIVRRTDKIVVAGVHFVPYTAHLGCHAVNILLGRLACLAGAVFNFLAVLVGASAHEYIIAHGTFVPGYGVTHNDLICVAEMRFAGSIGDCRCKIILLLVHLF